MVDREMLEAISQMMESKLEQAIEPIRTDLAGVKSDLEEVKHRVTAIEVTQENDVKTQLRLLGEGQQGMNEKFKKLDQVAEDVEDIKGTVHILEAVTKSNTTQIKELRLVK